MSIDTVKPAVARAAVAAGATLVNDVSASPLARSAAEPAPAGWSMHMPGDPGDHAARSPLRRRRGRRQRPSSSSRRSAARRARLEEVWIDPGIGFGKTFDHNLSLLRHLDELVALGLPGRGRHQPQALPRPPRRRPPTGADEPAPVDDRLEASWPRPTWAMAQGARMVRVHDVRANRASRQSRGSMSPVAMKGKWAQGIEPRNFHWVIKDQLAVCERPGGYGANHRRVRRQEEIIWIREQGFTCVISLDPLARTTSTTTTSSVSPGATGPFAAATTSSGSWRRSSPRSRS